MLVDITGEPGFTQQDPENNLDYALDSFAFYRNAHIQRVIVFISTRLILERTQKNNEWLQTTSKGLAFQ